MSRLCERPGCSEPGAVAYGMIPENLLFWIAPIKEAPVDDPPVLCRRHADQMSVPRGWTLDDRRERFPRLFMPRPVPSAGTTAAASVTHPHHATRRRRSRPEHEPEQLVIDGTGEIPRPEGAGEPPDEGVSPSVAVPETDREPPVVSISDTGLVPIIEPDPEVCFDLDAVAAHEAALPEPSIEPRAEPEPEPDADSDPVWTPEFDVDDTLNGLLKPKSPLLARAFRGTSRRR